MRHVSCLPTLCLLVVFLFLSACAAGTDVVCAGLDCGEHGTCAQRDGEAVCLCESGYVAEGTECVPDACSILSCVHGSCALEEGGAAACVCDAGYAGAACEACAEGFHADGLFCVPDSPCDDLDCVHGACADTADGPVCVCEPGYAGTLCDECAAGYHAEGLDCVGDQACSPDPCIHGTCFELNGEAVCECETGYAGDQCQRCAAGYVPEGLSCVPETVVVDPCEPNPCDEAHRSICVDDGDESYHCNCDAGYHDEAGACVVDPVCDPNPCVEEHKTQCLVDGSGFVCLCDAGYQDRDGDGDCSPTCATAALSCPEGQICSDASGTAICIDGSTPAIHIAFLWHMHQPIYWPYENIEDTEANNRMGFSVYQVHFDRSGPYTTWPADAVGQGLGLPHLGAQVSFSGSLMENLNNLAAANVGFQNWTDSWQQARAWQTSLGNPRLDVVRFGYHHPLMGLVPEEDIRLQLAMHATAVQRVMGPGLSKGIFPPECAFTPRMIPALLAEGVEWTLVDNVHFDRTHVDYPYRPESNLPRPNKADQINDASTDWVQLQNLWAPSPVAAPWGYQPHWVEYVDPATGQAQRIIAVPAARYEGNEDARGGFGAFLYEEVMSQYEAQNTDPAHPMLVVLHHDGDNYGGGTDSYYHSNFANFVTWVQGQPERFVATTIQDYLDQYPPDADDVIHVEPGSWSGADNGDPEFAKWNGDPDGTGHSPDRHSWAVLTAARNRVRTADAILPRTSVSAILDDNGNNTDRAWRYLLNAETSCYWYWDNSLDGIWDSHPTRAANEAVAYAQQVLATGSDTVGPEIYPPQREPYNPGMDGASSDFVVWTLADDVSGLNFVRLHWRVDADGLRDGANEVYAGGAWNQVDMVGSSLSSVTDPLPTVKAQLYEASIDGLENVLVDYYISAEDSLGQVSRSPLAHVWVGQGGGSTGPGLWEPEAPTSADVITITTGAPGFLHWGVDAGLHGGSWSPPPAEYWPAGSVLWSDGLAIESPLTGPDGEGNYTIELGPFNATPVTEVNFVFHYDDNSWSSPDQRIPIVQE